MVSSRKPPVVEHFDREGYFVDGLGPRVFTIAQARTQKQGDAISYKPVLGVDGYIVRGWSHLLAGWWRLGKSELMAAVILPWLRLGDKVLWITEEPDSIWVDRAGMFDEIYDPVPWDNLTLMDALSAPPHELLEKATDLVEDVIVVDTVREVCGIEFDEGRRRRPPGDGTVAATLSGRPHHLHLHRAAPQGRRRAGRARHGIGDAAGEVRRRPGARVRRRIRPAPPPDRAKASACRFAPDLRDGRRGPDRRRP